MNNYVKKNKIAFPIFIGYLVAILFFKILQSINFPLQITNLYFLNLLIILTTLTSLYEIIIGNKIKQNQRFSIKRNLINILVFSLIFTLILILINVFQNKIEWDFFIPIFIVLFILGTYYNLFIIAYEKIKSFDSLNK